jgi:hypothetical protein
MFDVDARWAMRLRVAGSRDRIADPGWSIKRANRNQLILHHDALNARHRDSSQFSQKFNRRSFADKSTMRF